MTIAIKIESVSKLYRLGTVGTGTISHDLNRWWHSIRGKEDPYAKVGQINDRTKTSTKNEEPGTKNSEAPDYVWALKDINLEVAQGEILGIIGRNGAGKSTLLKLLSRVTSPTTGSIKTKGRIASLLEVGTGFHPELTGRENIFMNGCILGMKRHEITQRLDEIVEFSGCARYLDTPTKRYSSGMTVRLGFAVAAHLQPEVLIVDEVLAVGDAAFQEKCLGKMSDMGTEGRTIIFVSHNMSAIEQLTRKSVVVSQGEVAFEGSSEDAVDYYLDRHQGHLSKSSDVSDLPRVSWAGDQSVKIIHAELLDIKNGKIKSTETVRLRLGIKCLRQMSSFSFGITLNYRDGTPVASAFSAECGSICPEEMQEFEVELKARNLSPGHYWLTIGLLRGNREVVDVIHEVLHFDMVSPELLPSGVTNWNPGWGHFRLEATCFPI